MTIESAMYTVLSAVCPRTFPDFAPVSTARPYITYQQIGGEPVQYLEKSVVSVKNGEFQINVWADTRQQASGLALEIEQAMITATAFQASQRSAFSSDFDPDIPVYGTRQDFSVWSTR